MSDLESLMKSYVEKGTITCLECFSVARKSKTPLKDVGAFCNEKNIKIHNCQLGCFQ